MCVHANKQSGADECLCSDEPGDYSRSFYPWRWALFVLVPPRASAAGICARNLSARQPTPTSSDPSSPRWNVCAPPLASPSPPRREVTNKKWMTKTSVDKWRDEARARQLTFADDALVGETLLYIVPIANRRVY